MTKILSLPTSLTTASISALSVLFFVASIGFGATGAHAAGITNQIGVGSTGTNVRQLQQLLATSYSLYPAGIVSGYYGPLTQTAVAQFQIAYNIPPVGNVGPITLAKLNQLFANNVTALDVNPPSITNVRAMTNGTNATITWNTDELTSGKIHYDVNPIVMYESSASMVEPQTSGGVIAQQGQAASHAITINGLNHGQTYYFSVESEDATGNVSVTTPLLFLVP